MTSRATTKSQREKWDRIASLGCVICGRAACIHHCMTGMGGRKDHDKVLALCFFHHQGKEGIHTLSRRVWQVKYGTETALMELQETRLVEYFP